MATPTSPERRLHARGFVVSADPWGTAEVLGATDEILLEGPSGLDVPVRTIDPALESNTAFIKSSDILNIPPQDIVLPVRMRYEWGALGRAIAMLFGTAGGPVQVEGTAYSNTLSWKEDNAALFGTYAEERVGKTYEAASAKPQKLELNFADGMLKAALTLRCDSCVNDSSTNDYTQMDALTLPSNIYDNGIVAMFSQAAVKINLQDGGDPVANETALVLDDFSVVYERPLEAGVHAAGSASIIEPIQEGISGMGIEVTLSYPRMSTVNDDNYADYINGVLKKMLIVFTGPTCSGSTTYSLSLYFPQMRIISATYPDESIVKAGMVLRAEEPSSTPTGMFYAVPHLIIVNKEQTDYLTQS